MKSTIEKFHSKANRQIFKTFFVGLLMTFLVILSFSFYSAEVILKVIVLVSGLLQVTGSIFAWIGVSKTLSNFKDDPDLK